MLEIAKYFIPSSEQIDWQNEFKRMFIDDNLYLNDDLVFFVSKEAKILTKRNTPETLNQLNIHNYDIEYEKTFYLNLILQSEFDIIMSTYKKNDFDSKDLVYRLSIFPIVQTAQTLDASSYVYPYISFDSSQLKPFLIGLDEWISIELVYPKLTSLAFFDGMVNSSALKGLMKKKKGKEDKIILSGPNSKGRAVIKFYSNKANDSFILHLLSINLMWRDIVEKLQIFHRI